MMKRQSSGVSPEPFPPWASLPALHAMTPRLCIYIFCPPICLGLMHSLLGWLGKDKAREGLSQPATQPLASPSKGVSFMPPATRKPVAGLDAHTVASALPGPRVCPTGETLSRLTAQPVRNKLLFMEVPRQANIHSAHPRQGPALVSPPGG